MYVFLHTNCRIVCPSFFLCTDNMARQLVEAINTGDIEMAQRLTKSLTLENQKNRCQDSEPSSGLFSITWEPPHNPDIQKIYE